MIDQWDLDIQVSNHTGAIQPSHSTLYSQNQISVRLEICLEIYISYRQLVCLTLQVQCVILCVFCLNPVYPLCIIVCILVSCVSEGSYLSHVYPVYNRMEHEDPMFHVYPVQPVYPLCSVYPKDPIYPVYPKDPLYPMSILCNPVEHEDFMFPVYYVYPKDSMYPVYPKDSMHPVYPKDSMYPVFAVYSKDPIYPVLRIIIILCIL